MVVPDNSDAIAPETNMASGDESYAPCQALNRWCPESSMRSQGAFLVLSEPIEKRFIETVWLLHVKKVSATIQPFHSVPPRKVGGPEGAGEDPCIHASVIAAIHAEGRNSHP